MSCAHVHPCLCSRAGVWCVQAVEGALREREAALLTVQCIEEDMARKKKAVEGLEESGEWVGGRREGGRGPSVGRPSGPLSGRGGGSECVWGPWFGWQGRSELGGRDGAGAASSGAANRVLAVERGRPEQLLCFAA